MPHFGYSDCEWVETKEEIRQILITCAKQRKMIPYSDLVSRVTTMQLEPRDPRLNSLIAEISMDEAKEGRGMLSALVVHKSGDLQPGPGFFDLAKSLGRDTSDILEVWVSEFKKVYGAWRGK